MVIHILSAVCSLAKNEFLTSDVVCTSNKWFSIPLQLSFAMHDRKCIAKSESDTLPKFVRGKAAMSRRCASGREMTSLSFQHTRQSWRFVILLFTLILYLCLCALVFSSLEKENDREQYDLYQGLKKRYRRRYNMSEHDFIELAYDANILYKRGYVHNYKNYWNFYHSFWFTATVVTTMGKCRPNPKIIILIIM